jgi:hypothetical protein
VSVSVAGDSGSVYESDNVESAIFGSDRLCCVL